MPSPPYDMIHPVTESQCWDHLNEVGIYSFFHTPLWRRTLCRFDPRFRDETVLFHFDGARALLPLISVRKAPFIETLESMPWGTYGGWVSRRPLTEEQERLCLRSLLSIKCPQISVISWPGTALVSKPARALDCETHRLDLTRGFQQIWDHCYAPRHRTKIRKAERAGLEALIDNSAEAIKKYKRLYIQSMRHWQGNLAFDPDFLDQWIDTPQKQVSLWLCKRQGEVLAGAVILYSPVEALYWSGSFDKKFSEFHPNNFLIHRTIEDAVKRGCRTYNFGSSAGLPGVIQFKEQFGPEVAPYQRSVFIQPFWKPFKSLTKWGRKPGESRRK